MYVHPDLNESPDIHPDHVTAGSAAGELIETGSTLFSSSPHALENLRIAYLGCCTHIAQLGCAISPANAKLSIGLGPC